MIELEIGKKVSLEFGGSAEIIDFIGSGRQGNLYLVKFNGQKWAMKWYDCDMIAGPEAFRANLKRHIAEDPPSKKLLWPKYITKQASDGSFGYITDMKQQSFETFSDVLSAFKPETDKLTGKIVKRPVKFINYSAMVTCAINLVNTFRKLHNAGKIYNYLDDNSFFVNVSTGAVLIGDCDCITDESESFDVSILHEYIAPEIISDNAEHSVYTNRYSLAVALFRLLFRGSPLEGEKTVLDVCLTHEDELVHYGKDAVFVLDPNNDSNRPVRGIHDNVIKFWKVYPEYIKEAFIHSFTKGLKEPEDRISEEEWLKILIKLRTELIECSCGKSSFGSVRTNPRSTKLRCPKCGKEHVTMKLDDTESRIPLYLGKKIYSCELTSDFDDISTVAGEVVENKIISVSLDIKNCSNRKWSVKTPDGVQHDVVPGKRITVIPRLEINFGKTKAHI